jgi:orotate phosphoribosyltransferase
MNARAELLRLLAERSFRLGDFRLSSGATSDYYIDCRATTLHAEGALLTGRVVLNEIRMRGWNPQAIGGPTLGADPIVTAVSVVSFQEAQSREPRIDKRHSNLLIHGFLVRKSGKAHGMGQQIEGFRESGARVIIVDDVCTTGASTVQAVEAARAFGFIVQGVLCLVEREEAGGRPQVESAAAPAPFVAIYTAGEVRQQHLKLKGAVHA